MATAARLARVPHIPEVSQADFEEFHLHHFSALSVEAFGTEFLRVESSLQHEEYHEDFEEECDDLGYYSDGVKRTLTDEQIAIFRHSEIEALRRDEEKARPIDEHVAVGAETTGDESAISAKSTKPAAVITETSVSAEKCELAPMDIESQEEGELDSDTSKLPKDSPNLASKKKKKNKKKSKKTRSMRNLPAAADVANPQPGEQGWFRKNVKPDLRKRTWDVVDTGMDSLDYDELEDGMTADASRSAQRRKISYDD